jgi:putative lipoic acid-binding regulatory protein
VEGKAVISLDDKKLELTYPCQWNYKVIIASHHEISTVTASVLGEREHTVRKSNNSKGGKYKSHNVSLLVHNDDDRSEIFQQFKAHEHVKMVL